MEQAVTAVTEQLRADIRTVTDRTQGSWIMAIGTWQTGEAKAPDTHGTNSRDATKD